MISHYMLNYGYIPLWVLINSVTLGLISKFYSNMKDNDKNNVARKFGLSSNALVVFLKVLTIFRNACAHDERFYNLKAMNVAGKKNRIKSTVYHITNLRKWIVCLVLLKNLKKMYRWSRFHLPTI